MRRTVHLYFARKHKRNRGEVLITLDVKLQTDYDLDVTADELGVCLAEFLASSSTVLLNIESAF